MKVISGGSAFDLAPRPNELGPQGRALWDTIQHDYDIRDAGGIEMLTQVCLARDAIEACHQCVKDEGLLLRSKNGVRENPAAKLELAYRSFVVRTLQRLGLDVEPIRKQLGRPPGY